MRVILPSAGIIGYKSCNIIQPTHKNISDLTELDNVDFLLKTEFLRPLVDINVDKITCWDRDYLFLVAMGALSYNSIKFKLTCPECDSTYSYSLNISDLDVYDLPEGSSLFSDKAFDGKSWRFKVPQVEDEYWALDMCYKFYDTFNLKLWRHLIAYRVIQYGLDWEPQDLLSFVNKIKSLPTNVYLLSNAFYKLTFHGVDTKLQNVCPNCGFSRKLNFTLKGENARLGTEHLMAKYANVCDLMSYSDFMGMNVTEYVGLVKAINAKNLQNV